MGDSFLAPNKPLLSVVCTIPFTEAVTGLHLSLCIVFNWSLAPGGCSPEQPAPFCKDPFTLIPGTQNGNSPELEPQIRVLRNVAPLKILLSNMHTALVLSQALRKPGMVVHACNPSTRSVKAGGSEVQGHSIIHVYYTHLTLPTILRV